MAEFLTIFLSSYPKLRCSQCKRSIPPHALCLTSTVIRNPVHVACFQPRSPINFLEDVHLDPAIQSTQVLELNDTVNVWNQRFALTEQQLPADFVSKKVATRGTAGRRMLLEVFSYLSTEEIEQFAAFVSKEWFHVSRDNDLWKAKYVSELRPKHTEVVADYRAKFVARRLNSCWHCKALKSLEEIKEVCAVLNRPICKQCAQLDDTVMVTKNELLRVGLKKSTLRLLKVPFFVSQGGKQVTFVSALAKRVLPHYQARKAILMQKAALLPDEDLKEETEEVLSTIDFKKVFRLGVMPLNKLYRATMKFCGENEECDRLENALKRFEKEIR